MNKIFPLAAAALMIASSAAYAGEGRNRSTPIDVQASARVVGNPIALNVGSQRQTVFDTSVEAPFVVGAIIPPTGANGLIQTANSLPSAPEIKGAWAYPSNYAAATGQSVPTTGLASVALPGGAS